MLWTALAAAASARPAGAAGVLSEMVLRRAKEMGEDPDLYRMSQPGPFLPLPEVQTMTLDGTRFVVQVPQGAKRAPLVVFSHGALVDPRSYRRLIDHWASHGFAVVAPVHDDGLFEKGLETRRFDAKGPGRWEVEAVMTDKAAWESRVHACTLALDRVNLVSNSLKVAIDAERPLVCGHEYGAYAAQLSIGTVAKDAAGGSVDLSDPRWYAALLLAPQGPGIMGLDKDSWKGVVRPFMMLQPGVYEGFVSQEPKAKVEGFGLAPEGNKHLVWAADSSESVFFGPAAGTSEASLRAFEDILAVTASFAVAYGNYDAAAFARISGDWIGRASQGRLRAWYR